MNINLLQGYLKAIKKSLTSKCTHISLIMKDTAGRAYVRVGFSKGKKKDYYQYSIGEFIGSTTSADMERLKDLITEKHKEYVD